MVVSVKGPIDMLSSRLPPSPLFLFLSSPHLSLFSRSYIFTKSPLLSVIIPPEALKRSFDIESRLAMKGKGLGECKCWGSF